LKISKMNLLSFVWIVIVPPFWLTEGFAFQSPVVVPSNGCHTDDVNHLMAVKGNVADEHALLWTKTASVVTSAVVCSMLLMTPPSWGVDIAKGETLFQANCAGCHAGGNNYVSEQRTLRKDALQTYRGTVDAAAIQEFVQKGMPHKLLPMKTAMDDVGYGDVVAYVLDQALGEKW
jgi:cytochrome c6